MNKIFKSKWCDTTQTWVACSELASACSGKKKLIVAAVAFGSSLFGTQTMAAECSGVVNSYVTAGGGVACDVSGTSYDYIHAANAGTAANVANSVTVFATSSGTAAVIADSGAVINFADDANVSAVGNRHGLNLSGGTINVGGDLTAQGSGASGRAIILYTGSTLNVAGNLVANGGNTGSGGSAVVENAAGALLTVAGTTNVTTTNGNWVTGMRLFGTGTFGGTVTVNLTGPVRPALHLRGTNQFNGDVVINTSGASSAGILQETGSNTIAGNLDISTLGAGSTGINQSSSLTVQGNSTVTTKGDNAVGVLTANGGTTTFNQLAVNTSGMSAVGVQVTGTGATTTLGSGSTISTTGSSAHGAQVVDGVLNLATGEINTSGNGAHGLYINHSVATTTPFTLGANIATTGFEAHGVDSNNAANLTINGNVAASGEDSIGVNYKFDDGVQAGILTTGGDIKAAHTGISASNSGAGLVINTAAGKTITAGTGAGIAVEGRGPYAKSNLTINNHSNIVSTGGQGILASNYYGGVISINNTADINVTGQWEGDHAGVEIDTIPVGIAALAQNGGGEIDITSSGKITAETGIWANVTGDFGGDLSNTNNITIKALGDITAENGEGILAESDKGQVDITTGSGAVIQAQNNAIKVITSGSTSVTNAANLNAGESGIDVSEATGGSTIQNSGDITADEGYGTVIYGGDAVETVTTTAGTLAGNTDLGAGNDSFTASGGALVGNTLMGDGDDVTTLTGTVDVTAAPQFDGGEGSDVLNVDGIALRGFTAASNDDTGNLTETNNSNLTGWETINIKNAGTLKLSNNLGS